LQFHALQFCGLHTRAREHDSLQSHAVVPAVQTPAVPREAVEPDAAAKSFRAASASIHSSFSLP
jgi:hypothetical protein